MVASANPSDGWPVRWTVWSHQNHVAGGANSSTTRVWVFVNCLYIVWCWCTIHQFYDNSNPEYKHNKKITSLQKKIPLRPQVHTTEVPGELRKAHG
jgi:hypothetical protein